MHPPARTLRVGIFPTLIVALVGLATMSHAQPMPQPQSPEKASGKTPPVVATTTLVTVTAPDGSESVYSSHRTIEIPAVPSASPAALCEGFWMGSNEVGFRLVSQTLIDTFKIAFLNMGVCSKVTVRAFPLVVSDNTITLNFDSPGVSSGSLTGTFCPGREQISGTFNYTSIHCGGTKSGRWVATPRVHCMAGPDIEISPRSLSFEVPEGGSASKSMTIKNAAGPGSCELFWYGKYLDLDLLNKSGEVSPDLLRAARPQVVIDKPGVKAAVHGLAINDDGMVPAEIHPRLSSDRPSPPPATVDDLGDVVHSFDYAIPGLFGLEWIDGFLWASGSSDRVLNKLDPLHGMVMPSGPPTRPMRSSTRLITEATFSPLSRLHPRGLLGWPGTVRTCGMWTG